MKPSLTIHLFGGLTTRRGDQLLTGTLNRKAEILLAYLAVERRHHSRESLATLFWDDRSQKRALSNLRTLLTRLGRHLDTHVEVNRQTVGLGGGDVWVDVSHFSALLDEESTQALATAADLYRGDFLAGVDLGESRALEEWALMTRERLRRRAEQALFSLARGGLYRREYEMAIGHARALLELEPMRESGHRLLMRLLARTGRQNAALVQFEQCRRILDAELGVKPADTTVALYERIRQAKFPPPHRVPTQFAPLVGRTEELALAGRRLDDPGCRLLSLVGPGGVGKTRLAVQLADDRRGEYLHGIFFVSLAGAATADLLPETVAAALGISLQGRAAPREQLLREIVERDMLLILDNVEHLVAGAVEFIQAVLERAPDVQIVVTSRERLFLRSEWLLALGGLPLPPADLSTAQAEDLDLESYASVALFVDRARRLRAGFDLQGSTGAAVVRICHLVEGLPLGIELAAAWLPEHAPEEIAAQIRRNLDFLATRMRDLPARHRSLRAAFEHSWDLLGDGERTVFRRLTLFRGGFSSRAAAAVTGAESATLTALLSKSLLRQAGPQRYELHEVLRQYGAEKLEEEPAAVAAARRRHGEYFTSFLAEQEPALHSSDLSGVLPDMDNIRAAWRWAIARGNEAAIGRSIPGLQLFYLRRGPFQEAVTMFGAALVGREGSAALRAQLQAVKANFLNRLGEHEEALVVAEQAAANARAQGAVEAEVEGRMQCGQALHGLSDYEGALAAYESALGLAEPAGLVEQAARTLHNLGATVASRGDFTRAHRYFQRALATYGTAVDREGEAIARNGLGVSAKNLGRYGEAYEHYRAALSIFREIQHRLGESKVLLNMGVVARIQGDYSRAARRYREALLLKQELGETQGECLALNNLGNVMARLGDYEAAREYFFEALRLYRRASRRRDEGMVRSNLGLLHHLMERHEAAVEYSRSAEEIARELGDRVTLGYALTHLGHALLAQGRHREACAAYEEALALREKRGAQSATMETVAGLARAALARDDVATALEYAGRILSYLEDSPLDGAEEPLRVYLTCVRVLEAAGEEARAVAVRERAHRELDRQAELIDDEALRGSFRTNVAAHRELLS